MLWLGQRGTTPDKPSELPPILTDNDCLYNLDLDALKLVATDLAMPGKAKVFCSKCGADLHPSQVARREEFVKDFFCDRLYCHRDHLLVSRASYTAPIRSFGHGGG
jgi:hypothetical protein